MIDLRIKALVCTSATVAMLSATVRPAHSLASAEVQEPWQHRTLAAFSFDRTFPVISNGYLLAHRRVVTSATQQDAVFVLSLKTAEQRVVRFWLPEASEIRLETAAIRADGSVLLGGSYSPLSQDPTEATFVAELAPTGEVVARYNLGEYLPERLCATPDGGFWTFGQVFNQENAGGDYALLRRYSSSGALVQQYFQRSLLRFGVTLDYRAHARNTALLSCGDTSVGAYVGRGTPPSANVTPRFVWFEVNTSTGETRTLAVRNPAGGASITGLVLFSEGTAYASYEHGGLFQLTSTGSTGAWVTVPAADPDGKLPPGLMGDKANGRPTFGVLLGRDGNSLVHLVDGCLLGQLRRCTGVCSRTRAALQEMDEDYDYSKDDVQGSDLGDSGGRICGHSAVRRARGDTAAATGVSDLR